MLGHGASSRKTNFKCGNACLLCLILACQLLLFFLHKPGGAKNPAEESIRSSNPTTTTLPHTIETPVEVQINPMLSCVPLSDKERQALQSEIASYEKSSKFQQKIKEAQGKAAAGAHHLSISKFFRERLLQPSWSILELGCAAGKMLVDAQAAYDNGDIEGMHGDLVGVELVDGWVNFAQEYYPTMGDKIRVYKGDITEFDLPAPYETKTFDMVMLNDVVEHIQRNRYGCFLKKLLNRTHHGSVVYMHTPTAMAQLKDQGQYYENVVPNHFLISAMASIGFELILFEHDLDTICSREGAPGLPRILSTGQCLHGGWVKYYHAVFIRRSATDPVFQLH